MQLKQFGWFMAVILMAGPVWAQWDSGSDGSDGAFNPVASVEVDLGMAASLCDCDGDMQVDDPCEWNCRSPVVGNGVYDADRWVVVYKYLTLDIPAGVTVTFKNHPSGAPVVWLASGNVSIDGTVNLNGKNGTTSGPVPSFAEGGPGGWAGGQRGHSGMVGASSVGFGPGSSSLLLGFNPCLHAASSASHLGGSQGGNGKTYDGLLPYFAPLHGGSGGTASAVFVSSGGGGGGGGAIFVACGSSLSTEVLTLGSGAIIVANGGNGGGTLGTSGGGGSGGIIRLRAPTLSVTSGAQLVAVEGLIGAGCVGLSQNGGIRIETGSFNTLPSMIPSGSVPFTPSPLFPTNPPVVRIVGIDTETVTADPVMGILSTEAAIDNGAPVTVSIEAENIAVGQVVQVRVVPARGNVITANSTALVDAGGGLRTATASVTFPSGRAEVQVRWPVPP